MVKVLKPCAIEKIALVRIAEKAAAFVGLTEKEII